MVTVEQAVKQGGCGFSANPQFAHAAKSGTGSGVVLQLSGVHTGLTVLLRISTLKSNRQNRFHFTSCKSCKLTER